MSCLQATVSGVCGVVRGASMACAKLKAALASCCPCMGDGDEPVEMEEVRYVPCAGVSLNQVSGSSSRGGVGGVRHAAMAGVVITAPSTTMSASASASSVVPSLHLGSSRGGDSTRRSPGSPRVNVANASFMSSGGGGDDVSFSSADGAGGLRKKRSISFAPGGYDVRSRSMSTGRGILKRDGSPTSPPLAHRALLSPRPGGFPDPKDDEML